MPMATMIEGMIRGETRNELIRLRPQKRPRTSASEARVPSTVARMAVIAPMRRLSSVASVQSRREKYLSYHWSEKPGGGNWRNLAELNETGMTTKMGKIR